MSRILKGFTFAGLALWAVAMVVSNIHAASTPGDSAVSSANSEISNGYWDGLQSEADDPGEMSLQIGNVFSGVYQDTAGILDTLLVDSVFAFSSIESLVVTDSTGVPNYDTVYFLYAIQNYGNVASDSFGVLVNVVDTTNATHFPVQSLQITDGMTGAAAVVGSLTAGSSEDSILYGVELAQGAIDSFYVRVVVPSIDSAADGDYIDLAICVKNQRDDGTFDAWPDTVKGSGYHSARRTVVDSFGTYLFPGVVGGIDSCLLDYGDTQYDTVRIAIGAATIRLAKSVTRIGFSGKPKPGDTLQYTIKYDNDGSGATTDPAYIVDQLPRGVSFVALSSAVGGNGNNPTMEVSYRGGAFVSTLANDDDSLRTITALRFTVPTGIDADDAVGEAAGYGIADDSTGANSGDAGMIKFQVRVR